MRGRTFLWLLPPALVFFALVWGFVRYAMMDNDVQVGILIVLVPFAVVFLIVICLIMAIKSEVRSR